MKVRCLPKFLDALQKYLDDFGTIYTNMNPRKVK